jgi:hypothetical protein
MPGTQGRSAANRSARRAAVAVMVAPFQISATEALRTFPTGSHRENTHGHTHPSAEIAAAP